MGLKEKLKRLRTQDRPVRFLAGRLLARTGLCRLLTVQTHGYQLRFHPTTLAEEIWFDPSTRYPDVNFLRSYLQLGDTYLDIGANIGNTVIPAAQAVGPHGRVLAFEPHPTVAGCLRENLLLNKVKNVVLHNVALGEKAGQASFTDLKDDDMNHIDVAGTGLRVEIKPLDRYTENLSTIALLKIDVEGYEKLVFSGAAQTLQKTRCLYFEVSEHQFRRFGYGCSDLLQIVIAAGFSVFRLTEGINLRRVSCQYVPAAAHENLIAIKDPEDFLRRTARGPAKYAIAP